MSFINQKSSSVCADWFKVFFNIAVSFFSWLCVFPNSSQRRSINVWVRLWLMKALTMPWLLNTALTTMTPLSPLRRRMLTRNQVRTHHNFPEQCSYRGLCVMSRIVVDCVCCSQLWRTQQLFLIYNIYKNQLFLIQTAICPFIHLRCLLKFNFCPKKSSWQMCK